MAAINIAKPSFPLTYSSKLPPPSLITWKLKKHQQHYHHHQQKQAQYHHRRLTLTPLFCSINPPFNSTFRSKPKIWNNDDEHAAQTILSYSSHHARPLSTKHVTTDCVTQKGDTVKNIISTIVKVGISVVVCGVLSLMVWDPSSTLMISNRTVALAASGGCVGGDSFGDSSSSSWSDDDDDFSIDTSFLHHGHNSRSSSSSETVTEEEKRQAQKLYWVVILYMVLAVVIPVGALFWYTSSPPTTIYMLQIASMDEKRSIKKDINSIGKSFDMSKAGGLHGLLKATTITLLQHSDLWISSDVYAKMCISGAQDYFYLLSHEEQEKFDKVTFMNVNGKLVKREMASGDGLCNYTMVIILVAVKGLYSKFLIRGRDDLRRALKKLGSIEKSQIQAVNVLWSPQLEDDTLTKERLQKDYPHLRPLTAE